MANELDKRFIELLEQEVAQAQKAAVAWEELQKRDPGARLTDLDGKTIATAAEMATSFRTKEKELRDLIDEQLKKS